MNSFGMIEVRSIAAGISIADSMVKSSNITIIKAQMICPGKYIIIVTGNTSAVKNAIEKGKSDADSHLISSFYIANLDEEVADYLLGNHKKPERESSVGVIESKTIADAIVAADIARNSADVHILDMRLGFSVSGKAVVIMVGALSDIQHGIDKAVDYLKSKDILIEYAVIPSIDSSIMDKLY